MAYNIQTAKSKQRKTDEKVLDAIVAANGISVGEIHERIKMSYMTILKSCLRLMKMNCISEGAIEYMSKGRREYLENKKPTYTTGYFFESDFPNESESGYYINN